jgi:hypothetical protein
MDTILIMMTPRLKRSLSTAGKKKLMVKAKIKMKAGRVPRMVDTSDTGPCSIAQKDIVKPAIVRVSLKVVNPR